MREKQQKALWSRPRATIMHMSELKDVPETLSSDEAALSVVRR